MKMNIKIKDKTYEQTQSVLHTHSVFTRAVRKVDYFFVCDKNGGSSAAILVSERPAIQLAYGCDTWGFVALLVLSL